MSKKSKKYPYLQSFDKNPDGTTTLVFKSGRSVTVPKGITIWLPPAHYARDLRTQVDDAFTVGEEAGLLPKWVTIAFGQQNRIMYRVACMDLGGTLYWLATVPDTNHVPVARGILEVKSDSEGAFFSTMGVAVVKEHQGQGVYPKILRRIIETYGLPVLSGDVMSPYAVLMWMSKGRWEPRRRRYRMNPVQGRGERPRWGLPMQRRIQAAVLLAYMEAVSGDRISK